MKLILALISTAVLASCASTGTATEATAGVKPYTSNTCIVTNTELGSMGTPITKVYGNQQVKFCCRPCVAKFEKDQQRYLSKI